jgi:hypothetical protein
MNKRSKILWSIRKYFLHFLRIDSIFESEMYSGSKHVTSRLYYWRLRGKYIIYISQILKVYVGSRPIKSLSQLKHLFYIESIRKKCKKYFRILQRILLNHLSLIINNKLYYFYWFFINPADELCPHHYLWNQETWLLTFFNLILY